VLLKPYAEYYTEYADRAQELLAKFPLGEPFGEAAQKEFIALFGVILRLQNILSSFDEFADNEILTERQAHRSVYLNLYAEFRKEGESDRYRLTRYCLRDRAHQAGRDQC
jgi:type I restriction enzyme R subunit